MSKLDSADGAVIIDEENRVDISRASYASSLSSSNFDEENDRFHVTLDRIYFKVQLR